ncbi:protein ECERIFERUM 16 isoform X2 [Argentina anserina]|uniref:protein ECERIFERUM 16 isoform X2 n=1 Tax=Argentina anserina TaxID=57926 RepID=UPI0021764F7D|nr:protein ECERIFERUM 16 isoform X2 [Potentilla anserina]
MDSKALAKSKRAHSQHHSNKKHHHPNQKSNSPAPSKQIPSNWDRYDEEEQEEQQLHEAGAVMPKSKGADYSHLISEAQSQSQLDHVLSENLGEWNKEGMMSMVSARGESILSWIGDDNFVVGFDKTAPAHHEGSFLSLNLHSLAEQLEKVDLSQRLFIEPDLLPLELNVEGLESTSSQYADQDQDTFTNKGATLISEASCGEYPDKIDEADQDIDIMISSFPESDYLDPNLSNLRSTLLNQVGVEPSTNERKQPESNTADIPNKNAATFEAATAEEELDMLLNSFSETKINDPSGLRSVPEEASMSPLQLPIKGTDSSILMAANLDDALDDLISQTSIPINQTRPSLPQETIVVHEFQSSSHTGSKSKELEDFDSWFDTL